MSICRHPIQIQCIIIHRKAQYLVINLYNPNFANSRFFHLAPPQNNAMPPPMPNYPSQFLVDHGGHMISQPQPPPPQAYMSMFYFCIRNKFFFVLNR